MGDQPDLFCGGTGVLRLTRLALVAMLPLLLPVVVHAQTVSLVRSGTTDSHLQARLGETISIDAVVDLGTLSATSVSLFVRIPDGPFQIVDVSAAAGNQPFTVETLFAGAVVVANTVVPSADVPDVFSGSRLLDFAATTRTSDPGRTGSGVLVSFRLRCVQTVTSAELVIDVNPVRASKVITADGTEAPFRVATGATVQVSSLSLLDMPDVVLRPGKRDSTTIGLLSRYLAFNVAPPDSILWTISGAVAGSLDVDIIGRPRRVRVTHAPGFRGRRTITFTATEPRSIITEQAPPTATETSIVIVNTPPAFTVRRDTVRLIENVNTYVTSAINEPNPARALRDRDLDLIVEDPEVTEAQRHTAFTYGTATFRAGSDTMRQVRGRVDPITHELLVWSRPGFAGIDSFRVIVGDQFTLNRIGQDTLRVIVEVEAVPDAPRFVHNDIIAMQAGQSVSLAVQDYVSDPDTPLADLTLAWTVDFGGRFTVNRIADSLRFVAPDIAAQGLILFTVTDPDGLSARHEQRLRSTVLPPETEPPPGDPDFRIDPPLPDLLATVGRTSDALSLDDHVQRTGDVTPNQIAWSVRDTDDDLRALAAVAGSRVLRVRGIAVGIDSLILRAVGPAGRVREDTLQVTVTGATGQTQALSLLPLPDVRFVAGRGLHLFDLDDFVVDRAANPDSVMSWQSRFVGAADMIVQIRADRRVFVSAARAGQVDIAFEARNLLRNITGRDTVRLTAVADSFNRLPLSLPEMTIAPGRRDSLNLDALLPAIADATDTSWVVSGQRLTTPLIDTGAPHWLRVTAPPERIGIDTLTVRADLGRGFGVVGPLRVVVRELIAERDFRVLLLPNAVAPDRLSVYIVSRHPLDVAPVARRDNLFPSLSLRSTITDLSTHGLLVWHGTATLPRPLSGRTIVSATGRTERGTLLEATSSIVYGRAGKGAPLSLTLDGRSLQVPSGTEQPDVVWLTDAVAVADTHQSLQMLTAVALYPQDWRLEPPARLRIATVAGDLYRRVEDRWNFVAQGGGATINSLGTYAVLHDTIAPVIEEPYQDTPGRFVVAVHDAGSGPAVETLELTIDGVAWPWRWRGSSVVWQIASDDPVTAEIRVTDRAGNSARLRTGLHPGALPGQAQLDPAYPNPFNPSTSVRFSVPTATDVQLDVFDILGQRVRRLIDDELPGGHHVASWDARDDAGRSVASGVYLLRLWTPATTRVQRVALLR